MRWSTWFLLLAVPASLVLLLVQPLGANFDAGAHTVRLDVVSRGQIATPLDADGRALVRLGPCLAGMTAEMERQQLDGFPGRIGEVLRPMPCGVSRLVDISNTALNTPVTYAFALPGWWLGRPFGIDRALSGAVVSQLVLYLLVAWAAIRLAPRAQPFLLAIAVLPVAMRTAATISSDAQPIALTLLAVALLLRLREPAPTESARATRLFGIEITRRVELTVFAGLLVLIPLSKTPYVALALLALLVPRDCLGTARRWWTYAVAVLASTVVTVGAWTVLVSNRVHFLVPNIGIDSERQRAWLLENPVDFLVTVGHSVTHPLFRSWTLPGTLWVLGAETEYRPVPGLAVIVGIAAMLVAFTVDARRSRGRERELVAWWPALLVLVIIVVTLLVMYVGEAVAVTNVAPRWIWWMEGRFFVPLLVLVSVPFAALTTAREVGPAGRLLVVGLSGGLLGAYLVAAAGLFL